ncbi:MAG: purine-nucleoside phosphorylase, partial [Actinobacteria bacterium]
DHRHARLAGVQGHQGRFVFGHAGEARVPVICSVGRLHLYEGHSADRIALPVRAARLLGAEALVATNASGAVSDRVSPGDIMLVTDHVNLTGASPLTGPNLAELGPRFPSMAGAYTPLLAERAREAAGELGVDLREGVYAAMPGPAFETPAEARMLAALGADAAGMSTVPEVLAARHAGMSVLALSGVTNTAGSPGGHNEVLATAKRIEHAMERLLVAILSRL